MAYRKRRYRQRYRRRQRDDAADMTGDAFSGLFELAKEMPWWLDIIFAAGVYFLASFFLPTTVDIAKSPFSAALVIISPLLKYLIPLLILLGGLFSIERQWSESGKSKQMARDVAYRGATEAISDMSWLDFEKFIGDWFKTQGYAVEQNGGARADGGLDITLRKDGELYLVQCKHWRAWSVPVETVRDLLGLMTAKGASGGFVVTSGKFTQPAKDFASGRSIRLIDGKELATILDKNFIK